MPQLISRLLNAASPALIVLVPSGLLGQSQIPEAIGLLRSRGERVTVQAKDLHVLAKAQLGDASETQIAINCTAAAFAANERIWAAIDVLELYAIATRRSPSIEANQLVTTALRRHAREFRIAADDVHAALSFTRTPGLARAAEVLRDDLRLLAQMLDTMAVP